MIVCPHCRLANPNGAQRCNCGWDFSSSKMASSYLAERDKPAKTKFPIWIFANEIMAFTAVLVVFIVRHAFLFLTCFAGAAVCFSAIWFFSKR
jgi:hypothetical protein